MPKRKCSSVVKSFGQNLVYYRRKCKLTQQDVADMLNLNRSTYTKYETSVSEPSLEILLKIANIFGVDPGVLLDTEISALYGNNVADDTKVIPTESEKKFIRNLKLLNDSQKDEIFKTMSKFIIENNKK